MKKIINLSILLSFFSILYGNNLNNNESNAKTQHNMHDAYKKADKKLNAVYKKLIKSLDVQEKKALRKAQRNWLKFRDAECYFEGYPYRGGTGEYTMTVSCLYDLTQERIANLKRL